MTCGGIVRPGLMFPGDGERWYGLDVDICRAVAAAVLGDAEKIAVHPYLHDADYAAARQGADDLVFLTATELIGNRLLDALLPGPTVFFKTFGLMVPEGSPVQRAGDLGELGVCLEPGTETDRAMVAYFAAQGFALHQQPFQEADEMLDAFEDGKCGALAAEVTTLAAVRARSNQEDYRILADVADISPVVAASPIDDGRWAAVIAWTVDTLIRAEAAGAKLPAGGRLAGLPIDAAWLGLAPGWQNRVLSAVGDYGAIYRRNLGDGSALHLPRGVNALWRDGGLMAAPVAE